MHVNIDDVKCQGHSRCVEIAPELFVADETGYAREIGSGEVPVGLYDVARLAVRNCPERAITIDETT